MKPGVKYFWIVLMAATAVLFGQPCWAQDSYLERVGDHGTIDWVAQKVLAKGIGAPPQKHYGKPQARPLAQRAAITDARRNLLEVIKGVHIDSTTRVYNFMVRDDTIVARVQGLVQNSTVEDLQYMSDGTVEVIVSMPLTGELGETLIRMAGQAPAVTAGAGAGQDLEGRLTRLEERIRALEERLSGLKQISAEQDRVLQLYKQFIVAWMDYQAERPLMVRAAYDSGDALSALKQKVEDQDARLAAMAARLDEMAGRLAALERPGAQPPAKAEPPKTGASGAYSGLVIDARDTDFRPCLKPNVYGRGEQLYPGDYIDMQKAIRNGYVRYYRQVVRAQQSERVGKLPYTVKARGTWKGLRALELDASAFDMLKSLTEAPGSFLAECKVVIVF